MFRTVELKAEQWLGLFIVKRTLYEVDN